jgi:hypothetical protein
MLVPEAEPDWPPRSPPAGTSHDTLLDYACDQPRHGAAGRAAASGRMRSHERPSVTSEILTDAYRKARAAHANDPP